MLTNAQYTAIKAAIIAETDASVVQWRADGSTGLIAEWLNGDSNFIVWSTSVNIQTIYDAVTWANLTPSDIPDSSASYTNRVLMCQPKQINLQIMLQGQSYVNGSKTNVRAGLQDALTNIPSGISGAIQSAGWTTVRDSLKRPAKRCEKIFATGTGTSGAPGSLVYEGTVSDYDVVVALTQV